MLCYVLYVLVCAFRATAARGRISRLCVHTHERGLTAAARGRISRLSVNANEVFTAIVRAGCEPGVLRMEVDYTTSRPVQGLSGLGKVERDGVAWRV